jgi:hypothetical protein
MEVEIAQIARALGMPEDSPEVELLAELRHGTYGDFREKMGNAKRTDAKAERASGKRLLDQRDLSPTFPGSI